jgi:putative phosphonate metabolism protein
LKAGGTMRLAVYYVPEPGDPLARAGCAWLGRDAEAGLAVPQPSLPDIERLTASPRRYGFHATLKPPMQLADGATPAALISAAHDLARRITPFPAPPLRVGLLDGFLAILTAAPDAPLQALADRMVTGLDRFRAPPDAAELARRGADRLDTRGCALLARHGYPYVLERWRFHMTLSERLDDSTAARLLPQAEAYFAPALARPRVIGDIALCAEPEPGADFRLIGRVRFGGA